MSCTDENQPAVASRKKLEDLPNELLLEITEFLVLKQASYVPTCKELNIIHAFSLVNRRMRAIVLPLLRRRLVFATSKGFMSTLVEYNTKNKTLQVASVREVHVGLQPRAVNEFVPYYHRTTRPGPVRLDTPLTVPFPHLVSFQCHGAFCTPLFLSALRTCPHLRDLGIAWDMHEGWPDLGQLQQLRCARIFLSCRRLAASGISFPEPRPYGSITRLALYTKGTEYLETRRICDFFTQFLALTSFPQLRVLSLHILERNATGLFQFIHRHPTLLEVNVSTENARLRLEALLTLIDGTGTWRNPGDPRDLGVPIHQAELEHNDLNSHIPPHLAQWCIIVRDFAFTRVSLSKEAKRWSSPLGSPFPRYRCSALSLCILHDIYHPGRLRPRDDWVEVLPDLSNMMFKLSSHIPDVERLRISLMADYPSQDFTLLKMFRNVCDVVQTQFKHLVSLAIHWQTPSEEWCTWGSQDDIAFKIYGPVLALYLPYLDGSFPFVDFKINDMDRCDAPMIEEWPVPRESIGSQDDVRAAIRHLFNLDQDAPLDEDSTSLLTEAWGLRYQNLMHWVVQHVVAASCPTLTEFEWWPHFSRETECARWRWKIAQDGNDQCNAVTGKLQWDIPAVFALVGDELRRVHGD